MQICRFCLCVVEKTVRLTENVIIDGQFSLLEAVKDVVPEIFIDIVIIPEICLPCVDLIKSAYTFREMCFRTEKTIRQYIFATDNQSADVRIADVYLSLSAKRPPSGSLRPILPAKKIKPEENIVTQTSTSNLDNATNNTTVAHSSQFTDNSVNDGSSQILISNVAGGSSVFAPPVSGASTVAPSNVKQVSLLSSSYMITNDVDSTIKISGVFGNVHFDDVEKSSETLDHPQQNATPSPPPSPADPLTLEDDGDEYIEDDGDVTIDDTDTDSESEDLTGIEVIPSVVKHSDTTALQYIIDNLPEIDEIEDHPEFIEIKNLQRDDVSAKPRVRTPTVGDVPKPAISDKDVKTKPRSIGPQPKILENIYESGLHRQLKIVPSEQGNVQEQWTIDILGNYVLDHDYVLMTEEHKNTVRQLAFKQRVYPCKLCKKPMKSVANLERHLVNHFKKRGSRCPICLLTMSSKLIHSHISLHRIECTVCEVMVQYKDFDTHVSKHQLSNPEYNPKDVKKCCNICNEDVPVSTFVRHYLSHNIETVDPKIVCDLCGMIVLRKDLEGHLRKNHSVK